MAVCVTCCFGAVYAQDTVRRRNLQNVTVTAKATPKEATTTAPVQIMTRVKLERINALQLSDAVKQMAGVVLKDYGGVGGIKTVSARGLGSQFSTLAIDGIAVGDCQNGQPDLGRFIVSELDNLSFANGQPDDMLQPARVLASGNVLNMQTAKPVFDDKNANLKLGFEAGSFGLMHPSLKYEQRFGEKLHMSLQGTYIQSNGDYPFTIYYTQSKTDSSSQQCRTHSAVQMANMEANLFYDITATQKLTAKMHYYNAFQQLPGPVIYYRETPGSESSADQSGFVQLYYTNHFSPRWNLRIDGKFYAVQNIYDDSAY
ncbi:MAG: TonB-dependent receptor plug domain-containing protein, partial [Bacteroidales bacterium]|nr:TonB-dependent receptor plug domain-containing protein [Bacteroidales bacterium]